MHLQSHHLSSKSMPSASTSELRLGDLTHAYRSSIIQLYQKTTSLSKQKGTQRRNLSLQRLSIALCGYLWSSGISCHHLSLLNAFFFLFGAFAAQNGTHRATGFSFRLLRTSVASLWRQNNRVGELRSKIVRVATEAYLNLSRSEFPINMPWNKKRSKGPTNDGFEGSAHQSRLSA